MTGQQIYEWLKRWGIGPHSCWHERGAGHVVAPCDDESQWVVIGGRA